jgi:hypothetical protein
MNAGVAAVTRYSENRIVDCEETISLPACLPFGRRILMHAGSGITHAKLNGEQEPLKLLE